MAETDVAHAPPAGGTAEDDNVLPALPSSVDRRRSSLVTGAVALPAGLFVVVLSLVVLDLGGAAEVLVALGGVVLSYLGLDRLCRYVFGEHVETALWLCAVWMVVVVVGAITAGWLPLSEHQDVSKTLFEPTLTRPDLFSKHPLGTDKQGLDILAGILYGARVSLVVGVAAALVGMSIGSTIGMTAGYFKGRYDTVVSLLSDSLLAFPPLILLLAMVAVLSPSVRNVTIALAVLGVPTYIRLARANTIVFGEREFVLASRALGARHRRIMFQELLPNVLLPVVSYAFVSMALLIVAEASLSFLGLSIPRPKPTWGNMIAAGQADFENHPHLVFVPGAVLFVTVYALNRLGDKARTLWDTRQSRI